jgi:exopolysaccharide biosynthesis operon protein EpsL
MLNNLRSSADQSGAPARLRARLKPGATGVVPAVCAATALLGGVLFSTNASAELSDTIHPFVSIGYNYDDNLYRRSDVQMARFADNSDTFRTAMAGVSFERPIERQLVTATAKVSRVSFQDNGQLDYTGKDISGEWRWMLGNHFDGHIGATYSQVLAPFSDFQTAGERNLRVLRQQYVDGNYRFHPSWQLRAGYTADEYTYDLNNQAINDRDEKAAMVGVDYLAASGSTVGLQFRHVKGTYPSQDALGLIDNGYTQDEQKINILWSVTGTTQVLFLGGLVQRKHAFYSARDDNGTNGRLIVSWQPTGKVKLTAQLAREYGAIEGAYINSALINVQSLDASWDISSKVRASASARHEKRNFLPFTTTGAAVPEQFLSDSNNRLSAGLSYRVLRNITLQASVFRERRSGSVVAGTTSFVANGGSLNAMFQF